MIARALAAVMGLAARRPVPVASAVLVLALLGAAGALQLRPTTATDTLVGRSSAEFQATDAHHRRFGDDPIYVLVRQDLAKTVMTSDLLSVLKLEGCLSGNVPQDAKPVGGLESPCARLSETRPAQVVFGPGTFINTSVEQLQDAFAARTAAARVKEQKAKEAARKLARAKGYTKAQEDKVAKQAGELVSNEFAAEAFQLAGDYGLTDVPRLDDPSFVYQLVFSQSGDPGTPKARFAGLFPAKDAALIQVRLRPGLTEAERRDAIALVRAAVKMDDFALDNGKGTYVVTGAPVLLGDLTDSVSSSIVLLLGGALLVMALALTLAFRARLRLLPLGVALSSVGITFGVLWLLGAELTIAAVGVLPVLIGLAVDYAIQLQSRLEEELAAGGDIDAAVAAVARRGAPTVATAAAATAAGFAVLLTSPVPMVRGFGALLMLGIAVAFVAALTLGTAVLVRAARRRVDAGPGPGPGPVAAARRPSRAARLLAPLVASVRGAAELVRGGPPARLVARGVSAGGRGALGAAVARPGRVLAVGLVVAAAGWGLDTQTRVESDIQRLVPPDLPALRDLDRLQATTGVAGEVDVLVRGKDIATPAVLAWMTDYQARVAKRFGYKTGRGCGEADLCPAFSLPDLFSGGVKGKTDQQVDALLDALPAYFAQNVITADRTAATLAFGVRLTSLDRQRAIYAAMREELAKGRPAGVSAQLAGLPVLTAEANAKVSSDARRIGMLLASLVLVALVLLAALRSRRRALVPLIPIVLATGWSALILWAMRIPLNPMSVTLGALVVAISTEFSVLLAERYRSEREQGLGTEAALEAAYRSTGAAVLASGITAIAGFAVLVLSDIRLLRDFGAVTVVDLAVSLLGVLVVLPSVLVLAERGAFSRLPRRRRGRSRPRARLRVGRLRVGRLSPDDAAS